MVIPCKHIKPDVFGRRGQMAEEVQTTKRDNEQVKIAVWYDYI